MAAVWQHARRILCRGAYVRLALMVVFLLVASRPAVAAPITVSFSGHLTPSANEAAALALIAPMLNPFSEFTIVATLAEYNLDSTLDLILGGLTTGPRTCFGCKQSDFTTLAATNWFGAGGIGLAASNLYTTGFSLAMTTGWSAGTFEIWIEDPVTIGMFVPGTITGWHTVPEPATAFMLALGIAAVARRRKSSSHRSGQER